MKHYFFFEKKEAAHEFYLNAIGKGIYATCSWDSVVGLWCVEIDIDRTMEAKNAKTETNTSTSF
jgi:TM2 domain-containing membrane protein YozV